MDLMYESSVSSKYAEAYKKRILLLAPRFFLRGYGEPVLWVAIDVDAL